MKKYWCKKKKAKQNSKFSLEMRDNLNIDMRDAINDSEINEDIKVNDINGEIQLRYQLLTNEENKQGEKSIIRTNSKSSILSSSSN